MTSSLDRFLRIDTFTRAATNLAESASFARPMWLFWRLWRQNFNQQTIISPTIALYDRIPAAFLTSEPLQTAVVSVLRFLHRIMHHMGFTALENALFYRLFYGCICFSGTFPTVPLKTPHKRFWSKLCDNCRCLKVSISSRSYNSYLVSEIVLPR